MADDPNAVAKAKAAAAKPKTEAPVDAPAAPAPEAPAPAPQAPASQAPAAPPAAAPSTPPPAEPKVEPLAPLVKMTRDREFYDPPYSADVHPDEVANYADGGWTRADGPSEG